MKGKFIVLEGVDGSGKTTLAKKLAADIEDVWETFEPTRGKIGSVLRSGKCENIPPVAEALLFVADRSIHTVEIQKALNKGQWVICDRYMGSTVAYQFTSMGEKADWDWLVSIQKHATIEPDVVILLDLDPEIGMERVGVRREGLSRFEKLEYQKHVRETYLRLARQFDYIVIDASQDAESVYQQTVLALKGRGLFASE